MSMTVEKMQLSQAALLAVVFLSVFVCGCGKGSTLSSIGIGTTTLSPTPTISSTPAQNGAVIVTISSTATGATILYTLDGTLPDQYSTTTNTYEGPFLVASILTVQAVAVAPGEAASATASQTFKPSIPSGTLVWSDEFSNATAAGQPNPLTWTYDTGNSGFGNSELEDYCAWGSSTAPCDTANPNAYVGTDGYLHIAAQQPSTGVYTSARLKTEGLFSFQYGRFEIRAQLPEAQGFWPAGWLMGNSIASVNWPACGEMDVMERIDAAGSPDWNDGSIHGTGFTGGNLGTTYDFPAGQTAAGWHTYGMIWSKGSVAYYIDDPTRPYVTYTPSSISGLSGSVWPFDTGPNFILLNLAVGGSWPGNPNSTTPFPSEMLVDYVRVYTN